MIKNHEHDIRKIIKSIFQRDGHLARILSNNDMHIWNMIFLLTKSIDNCQLIETYSIA